MTLTRSNAVHVGARTANQAWGERSRLWMTGTSVHGSGGPVDGPGEQSPSLRPQPLAERLPFGGLPAPSVVSPGGKKHAAALPDNALTGTE